MSSSISEPFNNATQTHFAETHFLNIGYEINGEGTPLLLLHGWPDDVRTWDKVTGALVQNGYQTIAPYLRGYGPTTFRHRHHMRSGQVVAFAQDAIDLLDALKIERAVVVGHDWGARAGYALAALFPDRVERLVALAGGYETGIMPGDQISPPQAHAYWYQWFWHTKQGEQAIEGNRRGVCRYLWKVWSPHMEFTEHEFETTAASWENPDWVAGVLHAYRVRWGAALPDPHYAKLEAQIEKHPKIGVPTTVLHGEEDGASLVASSAGKEASFTGPYERIVLPRVGHFIQRENPQAVIDAVLKGAGNSSVPE